LPDATPSEGQPPSGPLTPAAALDQAIKHLEAGRLNATVRLCHSILAAEPNNAGALHVLGVAMQKQGRAALGIELLREAILHDGSTFLYHRNLCEMLRLDHRLDEAAEAGQRAIALRPNDALAYHFLGVVHSERGSALYANLLAQLVLPDFPIPMGVLYRHDKPTYGALASQQIDDAIAKQGPGDLNKLMYSGMVWEVGADGTRH